MRELLIKTRSNHIQEHDLSRTDLDFALQVVDLLRQRLGFDLTWIHNVEVEFFYNDRQHGHYEPTFVFRGVLKLYGDGSSSRVEVPFGTQHWPHNDKPDQSDVERMVTKIIDAINQSLDQLEGKLKWQQSAIDANRPPRSTA